MSDVLAILLIKAFDALISVELERFKDRLKNSVRSSILACLDTEHAAKAAESMIDAAFARLKARAA